ncbi:unnamed protein product [Lactuca saligna]|uniref:Uncharacterized protein n=1 Tax=Lactuca saligna TaxID=75948 RepID=A0AA35ZUM1_LACSI|nr:unnamed protein product [Lactuca saligna]
MNISFQLYFTFTRWLFLVFLQISSFRLLDHCIIMEWDSQQMRPVDKHDDCKLNNKVENTRVPLKYIIKQDVKNNPIMVYMKGVLVCSRNNLDDYELQNVEIMSN